MEEKTYSYVPRVEGQDELQRKIMETQRHPLYNDFVAMVDEAVNKDYEGGLTIGNCFPAEWDNQQCGYLMFTIQDSYPQVVSVEFLPPNGMYIVLNNKKTFGGLPLRIQR